MFAKKSYRSEKASSKLNFANLSTKALAKEARWLSSVTYCVKGSKIGIFVFATVNVEKISIFSAAISFIVESKIISKSPFVCWFQS